MMRCRVMPLVWLLLALLLAVAGCADSEPSPSPLSPITQLAIQTPDEVSAGETVTVTLSVQPDNYTGSVLVLAEGSFGSVPLRGELAAGRGTVILPASLSRYAGNVTFRSQAGDISGLAHTSIAAGKPSDPILPLVGPRSIRVGGEEWTMIVSIPQDNFGNPVEPGTDVTVQAQHPAPTGASPFATPESQTRPTDHLFSWARVYSRNRAGRTFLSVTAGDAHSPERDVLEVPGLPVPFSLKAEPPTAPADGRQLIGITSEQIRDRFGNVLLDGTSVLLIGEASDGTRRTIPTVTQDGRIYTTVQAPSKTGILTVYAVVAGVESEATDILFTPGPAVQPIPLAYELTTEFLLLKAGPLVGQISQFVPDGTTVGFVIHGPGGEILQRATVAEFGYGQIRLRRRDLPDGNYRVEVSAGTSRGSLELTIP